jgi:DNA-binding MarR family transcriptional regulator
MKPSPAKLASRSALIDFWFQVQEFLRARRELAKQMGLDASEYEVMLMLRAFPQGECPSISLVAERLFLQHHIAAATVKRLVRRDLVISERSELDRRSLTLRLTLQGQKMVEEIVHKSVAGLEAEGPEMMNSLAKLMVEGRMEKTASMKLTARPR